jgi:hypothetical protein
VIYNFAWNDRNVASEAWLGFNGQLLSDVNVSNENWTCLVERTLSDTNTSSDEFVVAVDPVRTLHDTNIVYESYSVRVDKLDRLGMDIDDIDDPTTITLSCQGRSVVLAAPDFGDTDTDTRRRIAEQTRGLTFLTYREQGWEDSDVDVIDLHFSKLTKAEIMALVQFVRWSLGKPVQIVDHLGRAHDVLITNPNADIGQDAPGQWSAAIQMEKVPT